jgi:hypothetical protein
MSTEKPKSKRYYPGSLFWPVVLIAVGVVFLLNNLELLSAGVWDTILLCWPLLLVVLGLDSLMRREGAAMPTLLIGLGVIFMLSNFGQLAVSGWTMLWNIWPVFLVAIGLDIMFGRRSLLAGILAAVLVITLLGGFIWYFGSVLAGEGLSVDAFEQPLEGAKRAEITIEPLVGNLALSALSDSNNLLEGELKQYQGKEIAQAYRVMDQVGFFTIASSDGTITFPSSPGPAGSWNLDLTPQIPLDLSVETIVGNINISAQDLTLSSLSTSVVIGETYVFLPERGDFDAKIDGVIGRITIYVPDSMEISINSEVGILNVKVPEDYSEQGSSYFSPGYNAAENKVRIDVSQVIGQVTVIEK